MTTASASPLKVERVRQGLTRKELAARAESSASTLTGIENGHQRPSLETAERFAAVLGVPVADVFSLTKCGCGCDGIVVDQSRHESEARFLSGHNASMPEHSAHLIRGRQKRRQRLGIPESKVCERCGRVYTRSEVPNQSIAHWLGRKYCESNCRWEVIRAEERVCAYDGCETLIPRKVMADNWRRRYCSRSHAQLARWKEGRVAPEIVGESPWTSAPALEAQVG